MGAKQASNLRISSEAFVGKQDEFVTLGRQAEQIANNLFKRGNIRGNNVKLFSFSYNRGRL